MIPKKCSMGIMAFNEARNIEVLLEDISRQQMQKFILCEIVIIASGCTDDTEKIVERYAKFNNKVKLLRQAYRKGKASAINAFLQYAHGDFIVLLNADTRIPAESIEKVLVPLLDKSTGMSGGRAIPVNKPDKFMGYCAQHLWLLHHYLSLKRTKLGELIAFKNCITAIPENTSVDEAMLESIFHDKGMVRAYVPEAAVYIKGPATINEYIRQRERIFIGHLWLAKTKHYYVPSLDLWFTFRIVMQHVDMNPACLLWMFGLLLMEVIARVRGAIKFIILRRNYFVWDVISSTKGSILLNV